MEVRYAEVFFLLHQAEEEGSDEKFVYCFEVYSHSLQCHPCHQEFSGAADNVELYVNIQSHNPDSEPLVPTIATFG